MSTSQCDIAMTDFDYTKYSRLTVDDIKLNIRRRNIAWEMCRSVAANFTLRDISTIIAEYCIGTERIVSEDVAFNCGCFSSVTYDHYRLTIIGRYDYNDSYFNSVAWLQFKPPLGGLRDIEVSWKEYIAFILTGWNYWVFDEVSKTILLTCANKCDQNNITKNLLENLRSDILGA